VRRTKLATLALALLGIAACSGSSGSGQVPSGPSYANPTAMLSKANAAGFKCDPKGAKTETNTFNALSLSCFHGAAQEPIYFDTYPSSKTEESAQQQIAARVGGQVTYFGNGWDVTAETSTTLAKLKAILSAPS
jgi:hypothetical protein